MRQPLVSDFLLSVVGFEVVTCHLLQLEVVNTVGFFRAPCVLAVVLSYWGPRMHGAALFGVARKRNIAFRMEITILCVGCRQYNCRIETVGTGLRD